MAASPWVRPAPGGWTWHRDPEGLGLVTDQGLFCFHPSPPSAGPGLLSRSLAGPMDSPSLARMELPAGGWAERPLPLLDPAMLPGVKRHRGRDPTSPSLTVPIHPGFLRPLPHTYGWTHDFPSALMGGRVGKHLLLNAGVLQPVEFCVREPFWGWRRAT